MSAHRARKTDDDEMIASRLREEMRLKKVTQTTLGAEIGIHQSQVSRVLRERTLRREQLIEFLRALARHGIDIGYVVSGLRTQAAITAPAHLAKEIAAELAPQLRSYIGPTPSDETKKS